MIVVEELPSKPLPQEFRTLVVEYFTSRVGAFDRLFFERLHRANYAFSREHCADMDAIGVSHLLPMLTNSALTFYPQYKY